MKYKAIIFDLDGTLLDTIAMNMYPLIQIIEEELGEKRTFDEVKHCFSMTGRQTMDYFGFDYDRVYPRWVQYVNEYPEGATPFAGMEEMLLQLKERGYLLGITSSKKRAQYDIDMPKSWLDYFSAVILEDDCPEHKPSALPLEMTIGKLGVSKEEAIYVGDAIGDYKCCENAGVDFMLANWLELDVSHIPTPTYYVTTPQQVIEVLSNE